MGWVRRDDTNRLDQPRNVSEHFKMVETLNIQAVFEREETTPERRVIIAALLTYFEDIDMMLRRQQNKSLNDRYQYSAYRADTNIHGLYRMVKDNYTKDLCDYINLNHEYFIFNFRDYVWKVLGERV